MHYISAAAVRDIHSSLMRTDLRVWFISSKTQSRQETIVKSPIRYQSKYVRVTHVQWPTRDSYTAISDVGQAVFTRPRPRQGRGKAVTKPCKCIKLNS